MTSELVTPSLPRSKFFVNFNDQKQTMSLEWQNYFRDLFTRVGGYETLTNSEIEEILDPLRSLSASLLVATDGNSEVVSVDDFTEWIAGVLGKITVTDDGDGTVTIGIDDNYLPDNVLGTLYEISITDNGDGTITLGQAKPRAITVSSSYTALSNDSIIYADTSSGAITITLPAGISGKWYKIVNSGSSSNNVTVTPNGTDTLFGDAASFGMIDYEIIDIHFDETNGWW